MLQRFFIALLPPANLRREIDEIKQDFARVYRSRKALNSPAHITLKAPFLWEEDNSPLLEARLEEFAREQAPLTIEISGFGAFEPRVIYLRPNATPPLLKLQQNLISTLTEKLALGDRTERERRFFPHLTVAFRDLTPDNFKRAWQEYQDRAIAFRFPVSALTLLIHSGENWQIYREFPLQLRAEVSEPRPSDDNR